MDNLELLLFLDKKIQESNEARDEFIEEEDSEMEEYCSGLLDAYQVIKDKINGEVE